MVVIWYIIVVGRIFGLNGDGDCGNINWNIIVVGGNFGVKCDGNCVIWNIVGGIYAL